MNSCLMTASIFKSPGRVQRLELKQFLILGCGAIKAIGTAYLRTRLIVIIAMGGTPRVADQLTAYVHETKLAMFN